MFRLTGLSLRRCVHTAATAASKAPRYRACITVGLSAAVLAFSIPTFALDAAPSTTAPSETEEHDQKSSASGGAYNPETGEINWDCPCLGGMADGPCGEQFKAAFSCFIHSEADPKGINCVELFQVMQNCFREHPDVYAAELDDDAEADAESKPVSTPAPLASTSAPMLTKEEGS